jgi:UDP-3-O-[3-hydroxymyristoyl] N-acetylglucosamine deacetylase/3-hydroxyacyl-[acyl-carrier-protein] dehydratase
MTPGAASEDGKSGRMQRTLAKPATLDGIGLHTGETGTMVFQPAPPDTGIRFVRTDLPGNPEVLVRPENAHFDPTAGRRTILRQGEVQIHTMEHVLAAIAGLGIDNLRIETNRMEIPEPADGSAAPIARALMAAGIATQDRPRRHIKVTKPVSWAQDGVELSAVPYGGFRITFTIEYDHPLIGCQTLSLDVDQESFLREIAPARTFVLERDLESLRKAGWIRGGRIESAVVVGSTKILNPEPLRYPDEFVRHKMLDLLGDLLLLGGPLLGHVRAKRSGHQSHVAFVHHLKQSLPLPGRRPGGPPDEWDITAIQDILPHRYPFLLVDRILHIEEGRSIEGIKNVTVNEPFFEGHFPGHPIMPAVLILEAMAQVGGLLLLNSVDDPNDKLMYFMGIDNARFRRPVTPGDQLHFKLTLLKLRGVTSKMRGEAYVDGQLVAEAELLAQVVDKRPS